MRERTREYNTNYTFIIYLKLLYQLFELERLFWYYTRNAISCFLFWRLTIPLLCFVLRKNSLFNGSTTLTIFLYSDTTHMSNKSTIHKLKRSTTLDIFYFISSQLLEQNIHSPGLTSIFRHNSYMKKNFTYFLQLHKR